MALYNPFLETVLPSIFKLLQMLTEVATIPVKRLAAPRKYSSWVRIYLVKYLYRLLLLYS